MIIHFTTEAMRRKSESSENQRCRVILARGDRDGLPPRTLTSHPATQETRTLIERFATDRYVLDSLAQVSSHCLCRSVAMIESLRT